MPKRNEKEFDDIKAGVEGVLSDVPEPSGEVIPESTVTQEGEIPETTYTETRYSTPTDYSSPKDYGAPQGLDMERIHEIIEAIVDEKWEEVISKVGNIAIWKEKVNNDVVSIKQELVRLEENFRELQNAVLGRVKDYDEGIRGIHTEMKALEKVFEKILEPLTTNIKDLAKVTQDLKKIKH